MDSVQESAGVAFELVGYLRGAAEEGWLDSAPGWFVQGVQERLGRIDAIRSEQKAAYEALLATLGTSR